MLVEWKVCVSLAFFQFKVGCDVLFYSLVESVYQLFFDTELARYFVDFDKRGKFHRHQPFPIFTESLAATLHLTGWGSNCCAELKTITNWDGR